MTKDPGASDREGRGSRAAAAAEVAAAVADAHRREWAFVLAATVRLTRDLDLAEECVQDAYARALTAWANEGIPTRPGGWLTTVARNRALDLLRRDATLRRSLPLLLEDETEPSPEEGLFASPGSLLGPANRGPAAWRSVRLPFGDAAQARPVGDLSELPVVPGAADDRLRLIFICCHPALAPEARVALTLRLLCGLTTVEVARAFLVAETTMAARITRAKKKIAAARIPYRLPPAQELPERVDAVLTVVHLLFTTGHTAPVGADLVRRDLVERAVDLARMLRLLLPDDPDVAGLLALILLTDARTAGRVGPDGRLLLLAEQDRAQWDRAAIDEGLGLVRAALVRRGSRPGPARLPGRFPLMAAIAAVHSGSPSWADTDWREIVGLYDLLAHRWPSPVVALNRAVAVGFADGPAAGLAALDELAAEPQLAGYGYLPAARADFLRSLGRIAEARLAYEEALLLTENTVERDFLTGRLAELGR
ncbi:RNA polymerase sigma factor [Pseudofrankia inefficax]|uniref:Putative RNA polymerase, sigma-24 subunit, ECF subfamily n=1 Tax=Pseudofrankia inefficax (strain DSM 45817 / CECT 9037 / DDB 130130 / EuI1c) TaxID=298654 RepID=E3J1X6_PSEI1|nr:sigma-70 family RNA polymerase sigma factor [Pseudofrankia inefficax]ADP84081.1 putative RNA polymerase, sigma-24 subunit, ECF subfamily [Pseudofrankia inefficax]